MAPVLEPQQGTLVMREVPPAVADLFQRDSRSQSYRALGRAYRAVVEGLKALGYLSAARPPERDQP